MAERLAQWNAVVSHAQNRVAATGGGLRIEFGDGVELDRLARLAEAEQHCCAFLAFALTVDQRGIALEIRAPADAAGLVAELFGEAV
jgi:hypothetical protein